MKTIILLIAPLIMISACSNKEKKNIKEEIKQETSVYTVKYYEQHKDLREQRLKECAAMIKMTINEQKDCNNVKKSFMDKQMSTMPKWNF